MPGPSLAQLVRKWHRTYSSKNRWDFTFLHKPGTYEQDLTKGLLRLWRTDDEGTSPAVVIEDNYACIGLYHRGMPLYNQYSDFKILAADPRFFAKLDRMLQFATNMGKRRSEHEKAFMKNEMLLLKEVLG